MPAAGLPGRRDAALGKRLDRAVDDSGRLLEEQKRIADDVERLRQEGQQADLPEAQKRREDIAGRNSALAERLKNLADQIDDLSRQARAGQRETSARLAEASGTIRDRRLPERILSSSQLLQNGLYDFAKAREGYIRAGLEELNRQMESARNSVGQSREGKLEDAYSKARQLAEGLESMQQRLRGQEEAAARKQSRLRRRREDRPEEAKSYPRRCGTGAVRHDHRSADGPGRLPRR